MATSKIRTLGPGTLVIGETDAEKKFDADTTSTTLTPKTEDGDEINFLDGSTERDEATTTWTLEGSIKEDFSTDGVQMWCFTNAGKKMPFRFIPNNEGKLGFTGTVIVSPVAIGGDVKKKNDIDFSFAASDVTPTTVSPTA